MTEPAKRRVLIVDDEMTVCRSIQKALLSDGLSIDTATSGEDALRKESQIKYDVIVVDLMMPGQSGLDLLKSLKARNTPAQVIMITGYPTMKTTIQSMQIGAFDYLPKPFLPSEIRSMVARALERSEKLRNEGSGS